MYPRFSAALTTIALFALLCAPGAADARPYDSSDGLIGSAVGARRGATSTETARTIWRAGTCGRGTTTRLPTGLVYVAYGTRFGLAGCPAAQARAARGGRTGFRGARELRRHRRGRQSGRRPLRRSGRHQPRGTGRLPRLPDGPGPLDEACGTHEFRIRVAGWNYDGGKREEIAATICTSGRATTWFLSGLALEHTQRSRGGRGSGGFRS